MYTLEPIKVMYGNKKVTLFYRDTEGHLLDQVNVPVIYSEPNYLGSFADVPATYAMGDWFLFNGSENHPLFRVGYCYEYDGSSWVELSNTDKKISMTIASALIDGDQRTWTQAEANNAPIVQVIDKLVANDAFIKKLASEVITLKEMDNGKFGLIKSENYDGEFDEQGNISRFGNIGFAVTGNGDAVFNFAKIYKCNVLYSISRTMRFSCTVSDTSTASSAKSTMKNFVTRIKNYYNSITEGDHFVNEYFSGSLKLYIKNGSKEGLYIANAFAITANSDNIFTLGCLHCSRTGNLDDGRLDGIYFNIQYNFNEDVDDFNLRIQNTYPSEINLTSQNKGSYYWTLDLFM